ncbi:MAG: glycosyltransferase [Actinobacteria bacterium]|nr:glycosyltransferase [Actinomycetota bacterium]
MADQLQKRQVLLEETLTQVVARGTPISELEARLIADASAVRSIEEALRHEVAGRSFSMKIVARLPSWMKPRIGRLRHYEPKPLRVPARYLRTRAPERAPTITIVTPSFQQGRFLERTIYSVVSQQYPDLEYVVQDGGSSDQTLDVLQRFEPLLTRWISEEDGGQGDAINRGFRETTGDIMAWLNSDDLLLPGSLACVARFFVEQPDVDVVYGHRLMIDENDAQIGSWILPRHDDVALTLADYIPQETLFWRRRVWEAVGSRVDPSFAYALDWDLLLRFRDVGAKMARIPRYLGAFRVHDEQKTTVSHMVGSSECSRLRERVHGRDISVHEVYQRLKPYLLRHLLIDTCHRFVDRMPVQRVPVSTVPSEPWLRLHAAEAVRGQPISTSLGSSM